MVLKRPRDVYDCPVSSPRGPKRRQVSRSLPPSSPFTSTSSLLATPSTPYSFRNWTIPSDSPGNPFGRVQRLTASTILPRPTSYSKHLPLRFQLVRPDGDGRSHTNKDGVYRVVQVPLSYSLGHLRKLIKYVFLPAKEKEMGGLYNFRRSAQHASLLLHSKHPAPLSSKGKDPILDFDPEPGHLFEVQKHIVISRPGEIKSGKTCIKASTSRDPYHYPGNGAQGSLLDAEDGEDNTWRWEAEEDFKLSQLWAPGGDLEKGIIYHHDSMTQIHVTLNTKKIQSRKGVGNKPFLFLSFGSLDLFAPPSTTSSIILTGISPVRWNGLFAFEKFLQAEAERERRECGEEADGLLDVNAEGELDPDLSSSTLPMYTSLGSSPQSQSSSVFSIYPSSASSAITPFPASPARKRRVDYANKRMSELAKKVRKSSNPSDSDDDKKKEDEVDELADDDDDDDEDPAASEKPSDWDPFGPDEAEV